MTFPIPDLAAAFVLVFARIGTLVMLLPGIGERSVPSRVRLSLALALTLILLPALAGLLPAGRSAGALLGTLLSEIAAGLVLGLAARAVTAALQVAGAIIAQELGLSFAMTIDPNQGGGQEAAVGNFLTLLGITLVFASDLHHLAIRAIRDSYALLPPGAGFPDVSDAAKLAIGAVGRGFALGFQISAPFIAFAMLFNLGVGILSRLMPQIQIFFLAMPLTILIGFGVLLAVLGVMMNVYLGELGRFLTTFGAA